MGVKIWFLIPYVDAPAGGINNYYRLCELAEELGIEARVLTEDVYPHCDPKHLGRYWHRIEPGDWTRYDIPEIQEGDIVVQPEISTWKFPFSKPVRRVTYVQNWALCIPREWQRRYWIYNNSVNLTYTVNSILRNYNHEVSMRSFFEMSIAHTKEFIESEKVEFSLVTPYFDPKNFSFGKNDPEKIIMFPRKSPEVVEAFKQVFGEKIVEVDNLPPSEVLKLYSESGFVVLPSPAEGLCFPAIEAMLSGAVVISWPCGAPEEFLIDEETAIMGKFGDVEGLIEKTKEILADSQKRRQIAVKARLLAESLYTRERTKMELFLAYHRTCSDRPF